MNDKNRNRYVEDLMEASLARYSQVEPREGLEERLIAHLRGRQRAVPQKSIWQWYLAPAAVAAVALLVITIYWHRMEPRQSEVKVATIDVLPPGPSPMKNLPTLPEATTGAPVRRLERVVAVKPRAKALQAASLDRPKRDIFPTPELPSEQDQILLRLMRGNSPAFDQLLSKLPTADQVLEKIQIAELKTPVLMLEPITIPALEPEK
jgi:hypothetical protein